ELYLTNAITQITHDKKIESLELFIYDWLHDNLSEQQILERSKYLQIDLKKYRQVISMRFPYKTEGFTLKELEELKKRWNRNRDTLIVRWGQGKVVLLDEGAHKEDLKQRLN